MASRMKEDERNEKIIRGLLKLPANRRCINCNNLGPQYVCTNFWTFICTNCSGLHREFCHRVKSISMAKFTTQEVNALQGGGNERAKGIYFKEFDPQRHPVPDSSNIDRLRGFIKHVYVDRRFTGERNTDKPPRGKADRDDLNESRGGDPCQADSRSPPCDERYIERPDTVGRNGDRPDRFMYGERSPGYDQGDNKRSPHPGYDQGDNKRSPHPGYDQGDNKRSPRHFEVVDNRARDDRAVTGNQIRRFEDRRLPDAVIKLEGSSPSRLKEVSSPPMVRPVRDILGDDMPQLQVGESPKSNNTKVTDTSAQTQQRASSSSCLGSSNGGSTVQLKWVNSGSLIDFTADPEPSVSAASRPPAPQQNLSPPSIGRDWASFDNTGQQKAPQAAVNVGTLDSSLAHLSTPGPAPATHMLTMPSFGVDASLKSNDGGQWPTVQQHQTSQFPGGLNQTANPPFNAPIARAQSWGSTTMPSTEGPLPNIGDYASQFASTQPQETNGGVTSQPSSMDAKPVGRKALPEDLFTSLYPLVPASVPDWQRGPHPGIAYGLQYGMQYPMGMMVQPQAMPIFPHPSKSKNPFDLGSEPALNNAPMIPSVAPLQGALPQLSGPSPLFRSTSFGNPSRQLVAQQQSPFPQALSQGQYMGHHVPASLPQLHNMAMMGHQGVGGPESPAAPSGNMGMNRRYSLPSIPSSFGTSGGNPFG